MDVPVPRGDEDRYRLRLGPQHPATHGVLRLDVELDGETIVVCEPKVGYLHRGIEKLAENRTYIQDLVLTDRLDYIAAMANNCGFCVAAEGLLGIETPIRAKYIRTMVSKNIVDCANLRCPTRSATRCSDSIRCLTMASLFGSARDRNSVAAISVSEVSVSFIVMRR